MDTARVNNKKIAIVGGTALALAVAREVRAMGVGVAVLPNICGSVPSYLGVVEVAGGMAPAFDCAMTALGKGLPLITASPLLAGVHGNTMLAAARAQKTGLGLSGALLGALPVPTEGDEIILLSDGAAADALARIADLGHTLEKARAALTTPTADLSDLGGKITLCRALALHGLWSGHKWINPASATRVDLAMLTPERAAEIRRAGYAWRFGAILTPQQVYVGPLAVGAADALAQRQFSSGRGGLILQSGPLSVEIAQTPDQRALSGILHDVRRLLADQLHAPAKQAPKTATASSTTQWLPLEDGIAIPALGQPAQTALRLAA